MKKTRRTLEPFDWSRHPSKENIGKVFLADPDAYTTFGKGITKEELAHSIHTYNKIKELEDKKKYLRDVLYFILIIIPFTFFIYNITIGLSR
jgi:hypothetical protein